MCIYMHRIIYMYIHTCSYIQVCEQSLTITNCFYMCVCFLSMYIHKIKYYELFIYAYVFTYIVNLSKLKIKCPDALFSFLSNQMIISDI